MSKLIHEHLATEPWIQMWSGATRGEWTCGCGKHMTWSDRQDVGQLQWHMLACTMAEEQPTKRAWRAAIKCAVPAFTAGLPNEESVTACWRDKTDGTIHTACGDTDTSWRPPTLRCPCRSSTAVECRPRSMRTSGVLRTRIRALTWKLTMLRMCIVTANGTFAYKATWR
jgi:hypothetical protein